MENEQRIKLLKAWRVVGYFSFAGMIIGLLAITTFLPLSFLVMSGVDINLIAIHCKSMATIGYWCVGFGGVMAAIYVITGVSSLIRKKMFVVACLVAICIHFFVMFGFMIAGVVPTQTHKEFLQNNWNNFNETTTRLVQNHYSCCGFESPNEVIVKDESCYAIPIENITWPDGCYKRVMSTSLPAPLVINSEKQEVTPGESSWNNFIFVYSLFFMSILIVDLLNIFGMAYLIYKSDFDEIHNCSKIPPKLYKQNTDLKEAPTTITLATISSSDNTAEKPKFTNFENGQSETSFSSKSRTSFESSVSIELTSSSSTPWYSKLSHAIVSALERGFYWLGFLIGKHPKTTIVLSSIFTVVLCIGLLQRRDAQGGSESFLPADIQVIKNFETYLEYFTVKEQLHRMIIEDPTNVITADVMQKTWNIDKNVKAILSSTQRTFDTLCLKYTAGCGQESLFELWSYNDADISSLTDADVLQKIQPKATLQSPMFGGGYVIDNVIGGQTLDTDKEISSAKAHMLTYKTRFTYQIGDWESKFVDIGKSSPDGLTVYVQAASSYRDESSSSYTKELPLLFAGFALVFVYIAIMTGKFSKVRHRVVTAMLGVLTAGMAMGAGIGLSASLQLEWTNLHLIAPFLIIGIGVDDMFIILQTWNMVDDDPRLRSLTMEEKAGYVLKTAGVSITVTSITDLVAFAVGATSALRVFESFSVYTSLCIIILFFLQCTFFMACTVLDQRRREQRRDACICCHVYDESHKDGKWANKEIFQWIFENVIGYCLEFPAVRCVAILVTLAVTGVMAWGFYKLEVAYDPDWYIPSGSYVLDFIEKEKLYFPRGMEVAAYVFSDDMYSERSKMATLHTALSQNTGVDNDFLRSWYNVYESWTGLTAPTEAQFYADVKTFLASTSGNIYFYDVIFNEAGDKITASKFPFRHKKVASTNEDVNIMDSIYKDIDAIGFNDAFPFTDDYFVLEISKIIGNEVYRNIGITLAVVFIVVLPTIASLQMSLWVGLCVVFTIVDVAGTMHFAGLYIEASTVITLLLTVGLAVDYAAHIGHKYLTLKGSRILRMRVALSHVGPAVFNGGFSTFLALSLLAASSNYSYKVFFTVFTCVVWFGLWNGLVFLPSVLGFIGPPPHKSAHEALLSERAKVSKIDTRLDEPPQNEIERE